MKNTSTTLIYVLASLSIICCCFFGLGILLALPAFLIANNKTKVLEANPEDYSPEELKAINNAKTFALVMLIINGLFFIYSVYDIATTDWDEFRREFQDAMEQFNA